MAMSERQKNYREFNNARSDEGKVREKCKKCPMYKQCAEDGKYPTIAFTCFKKIHRRG